MLSLFHIFIFEYRIVRLIFALHVLFLKTEVRRFKLFIETNNVVVFIKYRRYSRNRISIESRKLVCLVT